MTAAVARASAQASAQASAEEEPPEAWDIAYRWWLSLQDRGANGVANPGRDRAALARLRRSDVSDCFAEPGVVALYRRIGGAGFDEKRLRVAARLALVLAHVRRHSGARTFARALGPTRFNENDGRLKSLRLQALLKAGSEEEIVRGFRRAVDLLDREANVVDLARVLVGWDFEPTRVRFAFDYFNAGPAAPGEND